MGMNFSPMYQPVSTKTIKADGDLNLGNYDLICTDAKGDTAEFSEFVGGVGNFSKIVLPALSYDGYYTLSGNLPSQSTGRNSDSCCVPLFSGFIPVSGVVSASFHGSGSATLYIIETTGTKTETLTSTQTEYTIENAVSVYSLYTCSNMVAANFSFTYGVPVFINT